MLRASSFQRGHTWRLWLTAALVAAVASGWTRSSAAAWFGTTGALEDAAIEQQRQEREEHPAADGNAEQPAPPEQAEEQAPAPANDAAEHAIHHAAVLQHLPSHCGTLMYVDLAKLRATSAANGGRVAWGKAVTGLGLRHPVVAARVGRWMAALAEQGVDFRKDVSEVALCMTDQRTFTVAIGGNLAGKDIGLVASSNQLGAQDVSVDEHDGRTYVHVGNVIAAHVAPDVVTLAQDERALDDTWDATEGDLAARGAAEDDIGLAEFDYHGKHVRSQVAEHGDALVVTTDLSKEGEDFDPTTDRPGLQNRLDAIASALAQSPLSAVAPAVGRSNMILDGPSVTVRTVLPASSLGSALGAAADMDPALWDTAMMAALHWIEKTLPSLEEAPAPCPTPSVPNP